MMDFFKELRRRHVFRVGIAYLVVAWLLLQLVNNIVTPLHLPDWTATLVIVLLALGFPIAVVLAWAFEMTPEGMRLSTAKTAVAQSGTAAKATAAPASEPFASPSIAVLPFADMSPDKDQEYFSDGLTEELLNRLVPFKGLRVIGRTSSFAFKGKNVDLRAIGETLGVNHILEGSVRKAGDHLRITAQLINPRDGSHLWSKTFDRDLSDVFAIQDEISRAVAEALAVTMGVAANEKEGFTRNIEAYEEYLKGKAFIEATTAENMPRGIEHLLRATEIDPKFAAPYGTLVQAYALGAQTRPDKAGDWMPKAFQANEHLQAIAPNSTIAAIVGSRMCAFRQEWKASEQMLKRLQDPDVAQGGAWTREYGRFLYTVGRAREAVGYLETARRADPLSPMVCVFLGEAYASSGDIRTALDEFDRGQTIEGLQPLIVGSALLAALATGDRQAIEIRADALAKADSSAGMISSRMAQLAGDKSTLRIALREAWQDPINRTGFRGSAISHWAAYAGDVDLALDGLDRQLPEFAAMFSWRPVMREVRRHPRFKDIMRKIGLVAYWHESGNWPDFCRRVGEDDFECV